MNYAGHEKLRAEVAEVANAMCDLRTTMNEMEQQSSLLPPPLRPVSRCGLSGGQT
ncbi:hypothetical protein NCU70_004616 [Escherichia coli]|nr:hypothetical protein [Escherichia coli]